MMASQRIDQLAHQEFGVAKVHPFQKDALCSLISGRDTVVHVPTGAGKSLIFWVLPFILALPIVIVLPTNALIIDQLGKLRGKGVRVVGNSKLFGEEIQESSDVNYYITLPEHAAELKAIIQKEKIQIGCVVVDECHLVLEWGTTFRKAFGSLGALICQLSISKPTVLALSATLHKDTLQTVSKQLMLKSPLIINLPHNFSRFYFSIQQKHHRTDQALRSILTPIAERICNQKQSYPKTLIFAAHSIITPISYFFAHIFVDGVKRAGAKLVIQFHGQTDAEMQKAILDELCKENSSHRIVIASSAFGLGVDIKDIRQIIFMQPPGATSELVQQIGRGGRDGGTCTCTIHYSNIELGKAKKEMKALIQASCLRKHLYTAYGSPSTEVSDYRGSSVLCCSSCSTSSEE